MLNKYLIGITPGKYDDETNKLLVYISKEIKQISDAYERLDKEYKCIRENMVNAKLVQQYMREIERSAVVLQDIALRKIKNY